MMPARGHISRDPLEGVGRRAVGVRVVPPRPGRPVPGHSAWGGSLPPRRLVMPVDTGRRDVARPRMLCLHDKTPRAVRSGQEKHRLAATF